MRTPPDMRCSGCGRPTDAKPSALGVVSCSACEGKIELSKVATAAALAGSERRETQPPAALQERYRIVRRLGAGGGGTVYLAIDLNVKRQVALKTLHRTVEGDFLERFRREGQLMARLRHPNVVQVFDAGEQDGCPYLAMEYVEGESLRERLQRDPRPGVETAVSIALDCLSGLAACHAEGILHRDIKPGNILIDGANRARIADLGLAREIEGKNPLTGPGALLGTPLYVSPEQIRGEAITPATDLYALGIVLYEMLGGAHPLRAHDVASLLDAHVSQAPRDLSELAPDLPPGLVTAVMSTLAKDPAHRPRSATRLASALRSHARQPAPESASRSSKQQAAVRGDASAGAESGSRRRAWLVGVWCTLLTSLALAALSLPARRPSPPAPSPAVRSVPGPPRASDPALEALDQFRESIRWPVPLRPWGSRRASSVRCPLVVRSAARHATCRTIVPPGCSVRFPSGFRLTRSGEVSLPHTGMVEGVNWLDVELFGTTPPVVTLSAQSREAVRDRDGPPPDFPRFIKTTSALRADPTYLTTGVASATVLAEYGESPGREAALGRVEMTRLAAAHWLAEQAGAREEDVRWEDPELTGKALETLDLYQALLRKEPQTWEAWLEVSWILCRVGQLEQSQLAAVRMLELWPRGSWGWQTLGRIQRSCFYDARRAGRAEEASRHRLLAIAAYRQALRLTDPRADPKSHSESKVDLENLMR